MNPLPIGFCVAVQLTVLDPATRGVPRNPKRGYPVTMADFDLTVIGAVQRRRHDSRPRALRYAPSRPA